MPRGDAATKARRRQRGEGRTSSASSASRSSGGRRGRRNRPYYSSAPYDDEDDSGPSVLYARLPSVVIVTSFLLGWLIGRHEGARGMGVNFTAGTKSVLTTMADTILVFWGLAVRKECESSDGRRTNVGYCSTSQLLGKLMRERTALERRMGSNKEYGAYHNRIFNDMTTKMSDQFPSGDAKRRKQIRRQKVQTPLFLASSESRSRLTRRILIKHLQAAVRARGVSSQNDAMPTFTWITAGDSAAAGHGNLYSQSYTAILEDTVQSAFRSLGINFRALNYGMGQYSSGPELGLCMNEVFGDDVDVLTWDFASLQPSWEPTRRSVLWSSRAGMHPARPILFHHDAYGERFESIMDKGGLGTILMDADATQVLRERMPDSNVVVHLPAALRNYRCGASLEGGVRCSDNMRNFVCYLDDEMMGGGADDKVAASAKVCRAQKFKTKPDCLDARYQMSWHPGWKDHALKGRLIGHFLVNLLEEALFELDDLKSRHGHDPRVLLELLEKLETRDRREFRRAAPDTKLWDEDEAVHQKMGSELVLRGESICHRALLPSRSRLEGITTEVEYGGEFDKGVNQFLMGTPEDGRMPLAFDMNDRQHCDLLEVDHKDFFLVREQDGWVSTVVPNDRELEVYRRSTPVEGIIVLCLKICPLNKCPDAYIPISEVARRSKLFITVDGRPVTNVQKLDGCHILTGGEGIRWGRKDQFELRFRINDPGTLNVLKISSIIVF